MTARALLEAVAVDIESCTDIGLDTLESWTERIRTIASSLAEQLAKVEGDVAARQQWFESEIASAESHWIDSFQERFEDGDDVPDKEHFIALWLAERIATPRPSDPEDAVIEGLDFEPDEQHTVADMANVGRALMREIANNMPDYCWNESPSEIICDLINERDEARAAPPTAQRHEEGARDGEAGNDPIICEHCPTVFHGDDELARNCGWVFGWDGWECSSHKEERAKDELAGADMRERYALSTQPLLSGQPAGVSKGERGES